MCEQTKRPKNDNSFYEILELEPGAPFTEIKSAYLHLKKLYSSDALVLAPIADDISDSSREHLVEQIEEAYNNLKEFFAEKETEKQAITRDRVIHKHIPEFEVYSGNALRLTREVLNVDIQEIALTTGIPSRHLKNLELERYDLLPPGGYMRIYLTRYAEYLSLDVKRVVGEYMDTANQAMKNKN